MRKVGAHFLTAMEAVRTGLTLRSVQKLKLVGLSLIVLHSIGIDVWGLVAVN